MPTLPTFPAGAPGARGAVPGLPRLRAARTGQPAGAGQPAHRGAALDGDRWGGVCWRQSLAGWQQSPCHLRKPGSLAIWQSGTQSLAAPLGMASTPPGSKASGSRSPWLQSSRGCSATPRQRCCYCSQLQRQVLHAGWRLQCALRRLLPSHGHLRPMLYQPLLLAPLCLLCVQAPTLDSGGVTHPQASAAPSQVCAQAHPQPQLQPRPPLRRSIAVQRRQQAAPH